MIRASQNPFPCSPAIINTGGETSTTPYRQLFSYDGDPFTVPDNLVVTEVVNLTSPAQYVTFTKTGTTLTITSTAENDDQFKVIGYQPA